MLDYLSSADYLFLIEPKRVNERAKGLEWEQGERLHALAERGVLYLDNLEFWLSYQDFVARAEKMRLISLNGLNHSTVDFHYRSVATFSTKTTVSLHGKIEYLLDDLKDYRQRNAAVVIFTANQGRAENLCGLLNDKGFSAKLCPENPVFAGRFGRYGWKCEKRL